MISFDTTTQVDMISRALPEYTLFPPLANGSQGVVFLGEHHVSHRAVAVKVLGGGPLASRAQRARFEREIETLFRLDHPNIIRTYESGSIEGRLFYVMQRVDGPPITDFVLSYDFSVRQIVKLFLRVCDGLSYAHGCGVIHRDIKPGNILIQDDDGPHHGTPYVVDFGLAKVLADREGAFRTQADGPLGTPAYMSPEQIDGRGRMLDVRSDIYSLGVVMYEVLSCEQFPYRVDVEPEQIRRNILNRTPTPLDAANPTVGADLSAIVGKCLEKDRALRYRSVDELADDLRCWQRGDAVEARKQHRWYRFRKAIRRHYLPIATTLGITFLLIAGVFGTTVMWLRAEHNADLAQRALQMGGYVQLASAERDAGRFERAILLLEQAIIVAGTDVAPLILPQLFDAHYRLAEILYAENQPEDANPHCTSAVSIAQELVDAEPENMQWLRFLGFAHRLRGRMAAKSNDWNHAIAEFDEALRIRQALLSSDQGNTSLGAEVASIHAWLGRCYRQINQYDESWVHYWRSYTMRVALMVSAPDSADRILDVVQCEIKLAAWQIDREDSLGYDEARKWLVRADTRLRRLDRKRPIEELRGRLLSKLHDAIAANQRIIAERESASD